MNRRSLLLTWALGITGFALGALVVPAIWAFAPTGPGSVALILTSAVGLAVAIFTKWRAFGVGLAVGAIAWIGWFAAIYFLWEPLPQSS